VYILKINGVVYRGSTPCMLYVAKNIFCAFTPGPSSNLIKNWAPGGRLKEFKIMTVLLVFKKKSRACTACPTHLCDSINSRYSFFIFTPETVLHVTRKQNMRRVYQTTSTYRTGAIRHISSTALSSIKEHMRVSLHARD